MIRLGIFAASLLLLPLLGLWLSGSEWSSLAVDYSGSSDNIPAALLTTVMLAGYIFLTNHLIKLYTGNNPLNVQRNFYFAVSAASATLGWLLVYLNYFVTSWIPVQGNLALEALLYTPLFALLAPAILSTRALIASFNGLLKSLSKGVVLSIPNAEKTTFILVALAAVGLLGGAAFPDILFGLAWLAPLLLLIALQLLWNESTIFAGLKSGDWGRIICAFFSGIIVCNITLMAYQSNSGNVTLNLSHPFYAQLGYAVFGLLCLQLGDVIAENWRGKRRTELFQQKKKFPIPVVVKKD